MAYTVQKLAKLSGVSVRTHAPTQEVYTALAQMYQEHPEFRKQLDPFHPELATFMAEGMKVFADRKLS